MGEKQQNHIIDIFFVIALFCLFALSAIFLITVGADIYGKTVNNMENNFNTRTALAYVTEKVRQSDNANSLSIGTFDESPALIITSKTDDVEYYTYLYEYDGYLKELMVREGIALNADAGQNILNISGFQLTSVNDHLINCSIELGESQTYDLYITVHSGGLGNEK